MKNKKGITLIALIITIIVMLILAIVSIKVASDSGLFSKAEIANSKTLSQVAREQAADIVMEYYDAIQGKIIDDNNTLSAKLQAIPGVQNNGVLKNNDSWIITMKDGTSFTIAPDGTVSQIIPKAEEQTPVPVPVATNYVRQDGLVYVISDEINRTATVYGDRGDIDYTNEMALFMAIPTTAGSVEILSTVIINGQTYISTSIGDNAFFFGMNLTNVNIPNTVTSIGPNAFSGCSSLNSIIIPPNASIGQHAFDGTPWLENQKANATNGLVVVNNALLDASNAIGDVVIPNGVKEIPSNLFLANRNITSVIIPNTVTTIRNQAFYWGSSITSIVIPESVTTVEYAAFGCWGAGEEITRTIKVYWEEGQKPLGWADGWTDLEDDPDRIIYGYTE